MWPFISIPNLICTCKVFPIRRFHSNPCSKFSRGCKFSQISCPTWWLFGTCNCKSLKHGPLYWDPPLVPIIAIIFYYYIPSNHVICIANKEVCQRRTIMQRQCTFVATIVCCLLTIRNWWFYISSHFMGFWGKICLGLLGSSRIANICTFVSNLLYCVILSLISFLFIFKRAGIQCLGALFENGERQP